MRNAKVIPLAVIAKAVKVDPRTARRRLRAAGREVPKGVDKQRWVFTPQQAKVIREYIRGD